VLAQGDFLLQLEDYILNLNSNGAFTGGYMMDIFRKARNYARQS
jgi:hypothetical protein